MSKVIKSGQAINAEVSFKFGFANGKHGVKFDRSITVSNKEDKNFEKEESFSLQLPIVIPAMTKSTVEHSYIKRIVTVPFNGVAQVDAQIIHNLENITRLSQVLPEPTTRQFEFSGIVDNSLILTGETVNFTKKLSEKECENIGFKIEEGLINK